jgi:hypothetical protein
MAHRHQDRGVQARLFRLERRADRRSRRAIQTGSPDCQTMPASPAPDLSAASGARSPGARRLRFRKPTSARRTRSDALLVDAPEIGAVPAFAFADAAQHRRTASTTLAASAITRATALELSSCSMRFPG